MAESTETSQPSQPSQRLNISTSSTNDNVFQNTFAMIKPTAVEDGLHNEILTKIIEDGFTIRRLETRQITLDEAEQLYQEHSETPKFKGLCEYVTRSPVVIMELSRPILPISAWRSFIGATDPSEAEYRTLRRMFGRSKRENAVHGSDSITSAQRELSIFWPK